MGVGCSCCWRIAWAFCKRNGARVRRPRSAPASAIKVAGGMAQSVPRQRLAGGSVAVVVAIGMGGNSMHDLDQIFSIEPERKQLVGICASVVNSGVNFARPAGRNCVL